VSLEDELLGGPTSGGALFPALSILLHKWQASGKPDFLRVLALRHKPLIINGASDEIRTRDLMITNQLLYQLSYAGVA
jgi:hypothetical protein